ncbi:hypothetical protein B566_EDAN017363 [Ephemera danica]|nr:hypothetical protein B566_EDAN017363 [Ephemera danica]
MKRNVNKMGNLWILLLVIVLQAQEEEHLCHGLNTEDSRICKVVINNFLSLMFKSRNTEPQIIKSPGNHTRYIPIFIRMTNQEMERQEQNDLLINASRKEIEAQSRLEFALQRENELKSKLDLCNKESEVRLEMARKLQDQTDIKLKESQQKLNQF